jgi:hypothetical protein
VDQLSAEVSVKTIEYSKQAKMIAEYQTKKRCSKEGNSNINLGFNVWTTT